MCDTLSLSPMCAMLSLSPINYVLMLRMTIILKEPRNPYSIYSGTFHRFYRILCCNFIYTPLIESWVLVPRISGCQAAPIVSEVSIDGSWVQRLSCVHSPAEGIATLSLVASFH